MSHGTETPTRLPSARRGRSGREHFVHDNAGRLIGTVNFNADGELVGIDLVSAEEQLPYALREKASVPLSDLHITWDKYANAAAITFKDVVSAEIGWTFEVNDKEDCLAGTLRYTADGELYEIELLDANHQLPHSLRDKARLLSAPEE